MTIKNQYRDWAQPRFYLGPKYTFVKDSIQTPVQDQNQNLRKKQEASATQAFDFI